jgi:hypothetical protein
MSVVSLANCDNGQNYAWKILRYVNDLNLSAYLDRSTGRGGSKKEESAHALPAEEYM